MYPWNIFMVIEVCLAQKYMESVLTHIYKLLEKLYSGIENSEI